MTVFRENLTIYSTLFPQAIFWLHFKNILISRKYLRIVDIRKNKNFKCLLFAEPRKALPNLRTDEPVCPQDELQCGNGQCINKALFCDEQVDCQDGSDENACGVDQVSLDKPR